MQIPHLAFSLNHTGLARELVTKVIIENSVNNKKKESFALSDTGASGTVLTKKMSSLLELRTIDQTMIQTPNSDPQESNIYNITLFLPNRVMLSNIRICEANTIAHQSAVVLIGMDIICLGDFAITNNNSKTLFSFSIPPHRKKIDFVERAEKLNLKKKKY